MEQPIGGSLKTNFKWEQPSRVELALEKDVAEAANWRRVCRIVDQRDGRACRCCDKRTNPEAIGLLRGHRHHIQAKSACGPDESWNLVTLCPGCHMEERHRQRLKIEGNADEKLTFWKKDERGEWYVSRRELAVRIIDTD